MKVENQNNHDIRFVEADGEWLGAATDIATALEYRDATHMLRHVPDKYKGTQFVETLGGKQELTVLTEFGIYKAIFGSRKPEAEQFQEWVFTTIQQLRKSTGLEGFEVFRLLDKQHQKEAMARLQSGLRNPVQVSFIKANAIANKAISTKFGYPKMVKKDAMTPEMLVQREPILDDVVQLMKMNDEYELGLSVSKTIYSKVG